MWSYAVASDGTPVFYESWGTRTVAMPMLLCDGIGCDGYVWRYLRDDLADRPGLHLHYRGHGRTPAPRDPARITVEDLADDVASVLDDALIEQTVVIGHSMGVQVALEAYRRHPSRIAGLVLLCGAPSHPLRTFRGAAQLEEMLPLIQRWVQRVPGVVNRLTRWMLPTRLAYEIAARLEIRRELVEPADFMPYLEGMARIDARLFVAMLAAAGHHTADAMLETIAVPTLVVAGGRDGFTPAERSRQMAAMIPGAELLELPHASHTAPIEQPHIVDEAIRRFFARIEGNAGEPRTNVRALHKDD